MYVVVSLLLGLLFVPITAGFTFFLVGVVINDLGINGSTVIITMLTVGLGGLLSWAALYSGARNSFATKPIAPLSVAISVAIPGVIIGLVWAAWNVQPTLILLACAGAGAWGMYKGAAAGARNAAMSVGIGDLCAHCGYDLSATPAHQVCPECGGTFRFDRARIG